jgi:hypothetical protein
MKETCLAFFLVRALFTGGPIQTWTRSRLASRSDAGAGDPEIYRALAVIDLSSDEHPPNNSVTIYY